MLCGVKNKNRSEREKSLNFYDDSYGFIVKCCGNTERSFVEMGGEAAGETEDLIIMGRDEDKGISSQRFIQLDCLDSWLHGECVKHFHKSASV